MQAWAVTTRQKVPMHLQQSSSLSGAALAQASAATAGSTALVGWVVIGVALQCVAWNRHEVRSVHCCPRSRWEHPD